MTILNDLKSFIVQNNLAKNEDIAFNFDDFLSDSNKIVLLCKGGEFSDIAKKTKVSIIVKNILMKDAELISNNLFDSFCPPKQYEKPVSINNKLMLVKAVNSPSYKEKEKNGRHVFHFDLNIIHKR